MITIRTCTTRTGVIEWVVPPEVEELLESQSPEEREATERRIRKLLRRIAFLRGRAEISPFSGAAHEVINGQLHMANKRILDLCGNIDEAMDRQVSNKLRWELPYRIEEAAKLMRDTELADRVTLGLGFYVHIITLSETDPRFARAQLVLDRQLHAAARALRAVFDAEAVRKN